MKKVFSIAAIATLSSLMGSTAFADVTASATATWDATATKDTTSELVVTPLKSLIFKYAEGLESFNTVVGAFDVTIKGQTGATDFDLKSKVITDTLINPADQSELQVGVAWNGDKLSKTTDLVMIDAAQNINAGLEALAANFAADGRTSTQGNFTFTIDSASVDGSPVDFSQLTDGLWNGDVSVQFTATWKE
jgi:Mat/Ecp fimbriae major subunit